ncbi:MAG: M1 family metallopeptidase [Acidobacteriota bacterium]|nr:M1 family metallopeptidase [Acidobacteriota bacterium]
MLSAKARKLLLAAAAALSCALELPAAQLTPPIASYEISCRLDTDKKTVEGTELITWTNRTSRPASALQFHLYLNAFRNTRSTFHRESGGRGRRGEPLPESWGSIELTRMTYADGTDLLPALVYIAPDDGNRDDRTVAEVTLPKPVAPGETARVSVDFRSRLPRVARRTGWKGDFYMVAQWFPKLGVLQETGWNCHQFHANSEFFSDFGDYDVSIDVPARYKGRVGATGKQVEERAGNGERVLYRFRQESVHDFAWTADPGYLVRRDFFREAGLVDVELILLLQPEHASQAERHFRAAKAGLSLMGRVLGGYPYSTLTIVDPPWGGSAAGGMEYPTLITAGTHLVAPANVHEPEEVVVHEFGHQYFYGMLASNEFEEPYLDEGFDQYMTARVLKTAYGPNHPVVNFFGFRFPLGIDLFYPVDDNRRFFKLATADLHAQKSWGFRDRPTYGGSTYSHTALALATLENMVGTGTMDRALRLYFERWRFRHPTLSDFIGAANEVTGRDWTWFFDRTFHGAEDTDYAVEEVRSTPSKPPRGLFEKDGRLSEGPPPELAKARGWDSVALVTRKGGVVLPVEVLLRFEGGKSYRSVWDGAGRWKRFRIQGGPRLVEAIVDPDEKIALDSDRTNNGRRSRGDPRAATRWTSRSVFWTQNFLDALTVVW